MILFKLTTYFLAKRKSDKSMNPAKGPVYRKWMQAAKEAEDTLGLTRQERVDQYLVSYAHKLNPPTSNTPKSSPRPTPKAVVSTAKNSTAKKKTSNLPTGWLAEKRMKEGKELTIYISPDGEEFQVGNASCLLFRLSKLSMYLEVLIRKAGFI